MMDKFPLEPARALIMPHAWDMGFLVFSGAVFALFVLYALYQTLGKREPLLLFLLIGGLAGETLEPICDLLGMAYHPEIGQMIGFTTLGRHIPLWLIFCYPWYFAGFSYRLITWENRGELTWLRFWKTFGVAAFFCFTIEIFPVKAVLWQYFGPQPLMYSGMPLMWYVVNPTSDIATAAFLTLAMRGLSGWRRWPILFLMPVCIVGFHTGAFAPVYVTENAGWSAQQSILTAVISAIACAVLLTTLGRLLFSTRAVAVSTRAVPASASAVADTTRVVPERSRSVAGRA